MGQQVPDRDRFDGTKRVRDLPQFGDVLDDGIVEPDEAAIAELHDPDGGERLGDRRPMENGGAVHLPARRQVAQTGVLPRDDAAVPDQDETAADDAVCLEGGPVERGHVGPPDGRLCDNGGAAGDSQGRNGQDSGAHPESLPQRALTRAPGDRSRPISEQSPDRKPSGVTWSDWRTRQSDVRSERSRA